MATKHDLNATVLAKDHLSSTDVLGLINQNEDDDDIVDLYELFFYLVDRIRHIVLWFFVGALVMNIIVYFTMPPKYTSTAKMYVVSASSDSVVNLADLNLGSSLTADYEELILSYSVLDSIIQEYNLDITYEKLKKMITIYNPTDTRVLKIGVTTGDPQLSCDMANSIMAKAIEFLPETMSTNAPNVAEEARVAEKKSSPGYGKYTVLGALIGTFLSCAWFILQYMLDDTIHTQEDMERIFGIVPLTSVPESDIIDDEVGGKKKKGNLKRKLDNLNRRGNK